MILMALPVWRLIISVNHHVQTCCAAIAHQVSCENSCSLVSGLPGPHNRRKGRRRRISTDRGSILRHLLAVPFLGSYLVEMKGKLNEMSKNLILNSIYIYIFIVPLLDAAKASQMAIYFWAAWDRRSLEDW